MRKKFAALGLALMLTVSLTACGGGSSAPASSAAPAAPATSEAADGAAAGGEVKGLEGPIAESPILLTSVGQSADVEMVKVMMDKGGLSPETNSLATEADLGDSKTLVLAIGGSSKGLGAAGIDANQELERVNKLIAAADEKGMTIIALHIGGEARRGDLSDKFVAPSFEKADYAIVVADGNKDGLMSDLASKAGIPMDEVTTMADVVEPLKAAFK
ncbi:MAG: hypothetical protein HFG23_05215 [Anaerotruncus sp.]|nr:hypothetical protein [Anaerotruncus sp.]